MVAPRTYIALNLLTADNSSIFPNADGVVNMDQHDYNDQDLISRSLACSLTQSCH
jgi:hypothetical protein